MRTGGRQEPYTYGSLPGKEDFYFEDFKRLSRQSRAASSAVLIAAEHGG
jgi:hypothetical protein